LGNKLSLDGAFLVLYYYAVKTVTFHCCDISKHDVHNYNMTKSAAKLCDMSGNFTVSRGVLPCTMHMMKIVFFVDCALNQLLSLLN